MWELIYKFHGNIDNDIKTHFRLIRYENKISGDDIMNNFWPFEGLFHFRVKDGNINNHVWLDINKDMKFNNTLQSSSSSSSSFRRLEIRALIISLPTIDNNITLNDNNDDMIDLEDYYDTIITKIGDRSFDNGYLYRGDRLINDFTKPTIFNGGLDIDNNKKKTLIQKMKKGFTKRSAKGMEKAKGAMKATKSFFSTVASITGAATKLVAGKVNEIITNAAATPSVLSEASAETLGDLSDLLSTGFDDKTSSHIAMLKDLWEAFTLIGLQEDPSSSSSSSSSTLKYHRKHKLWKIAGSQSEDPILDHKNVGLLAIRATSYLCRKFPRRSRHMLMTNRVNSKDKYPLLIVSVNVTEMLGQLLCLRNDKYLGIRAFYWEMFETSTAFEELFVLSFCHLDRLWEDRGAQRSDFGNLIKEVKEMMRQVLQRGPKTIEMLWAIAEDEGMNIPQREE